MQKIMSCTLWVSLALTCLIFGALFPGELFAEDLDSLFSKVEKLKIERQGYTLGKALEKAQLKVAKSHPVESAAAGTFKFQDKALFIVAQEKTNRVLVIYEQFEKATQKNIQDLIGDLYMTFDEPTVLAHDKVVYWAYTPKGKVSSEKFDTAKDKKKALNILATVKFVSDIKIMEKQKEATSGSAYYIISSDPILKTVGS